MLYTVVLRNNMLTENTLRSTELQNICKDYISRYEWSNDVGVVTGENSHYVIVVMSVNKQFFPIKDFPIQEFAGRVYDYMKQKRDC
jgi:hypothetical protein